ncbi:MAG: hypothetical protein OER95_11880 [Acidimicrobiia bacterium]|nr:hypothetical protein [Acidimicrobiia bacterium]
MKANRHRVLLSLIAGAMATVGTAALLASSGRVQPAPPPGSGRPERSEVAEGDVPTRSANPLERSLLEGPARLLPLPTDEIDLPVTPGDQVEIVGLLPTVEAVTAEIVTSEALVVAVDRKTTVLLMTADEAHRIIEIRAVGQLAILGRPSLEPPRR